jgi:predicted transcriptional regulator
MFKMAAAIGSDTSTIDKALEDLLNSNLMPKTPGK